MRDRRKGFGLSIWWVGVSIRFGKSRYDLPEGGRKTQQFWFCWCDMSKGHLSGDVRWANESMNLELFRG